MARLVCAFDLPAVHESMLPRGARLQHCKGRIELLTAVTAADSAVVLLDVERPDAASMIVMLNEVRPSLPIVGVGTKGEAIEEAHKAGCHIFVGTPLNSDQVAAVLTQIWGVGTDKNQRIQVVGVMGAIGAAGATTIACHVATEIAALQHTRTLLIDADLEFGGSARAFDMRPEHTISDLAHAPSPDLVMLKKSVCEVGTQCDLLARPNNIREAHEVDEAAMQRIIRLATRGYSHVILDLPRRLDPVAGAVIELCDKLLVVTQLTVPGLDNASHLIGGLETEGFPKDRIDVVINRFRKGGYSCTLEMVEQQLSRTPLAVVPNDFQSVNRAIDAGKALPANNPVRMAISQLVTRLSKPGQAEAQTGGGKSWLDRLGLTATK